MSPEFPRFQPVRAKGLSERARALGGFSVSTPCHLQGRKQRGPNGVQARDRTSDRWGGLTTIPNAPKMPFPPVRKGDGSRMGVHTLTRAERPPAGRGSTMKATHVHTGSSPDSHPRSRGDVSTLGSARSSGQSLLLEFSPSRHHRGRQNSMLSLPCREARGELGIEGGITLESDPHPGGRTTGQTSVSIYRIRKRRGAERPTLLAYKQTKESPTQGAFVVSTIWLHACYYSVRLPA